ncbi:MAG: peptidyl-prolyl cis-trans isomerase [Sphingobium sp.]
MMTTTSDPSLSVWDPKAVVPRRSLILCALGAILGLVIAGYGLFTAQGTRIAGVSPENAATVNNVPILRADLIQQVASLYAIKFAEATPEQKHKALNDMIREELHVQRGIEMGLPNDDIDVRAALVGATDAQIAQDTLTEQPSEQDLHIWYAAHPDSYNSEGLMTLHEWVLPGSADEAAKAAKALRGGTPAATLRLKTSGRVDDGEEYYFAARIHLGPAIFATARKLRAGEVSEPIKGTDGFHILQMIANQLPVPTPYAKARDEVLRDFQADKVKRLQTANDRFLSKRADIKIASDLQ